VPFLKKVVILFKLFLFLIYEVRQINEITAATHFVVKKGGRKEVTIMKAMKGFRWSVLFSFIVVLILSAYGGISSSAEKFPSREIIIVVPYAAGGVTDLSTRALAEYLKKELGVPVVVENRPEAASVKGIVDVYKAKPDGYMLLANTIARFAQMEVAYKTPYKILDMTYLAAFVGSPMYVVVREDSPYRKLQDLAEASKKKSLNCSITGVGGITHLGAMVLKKKVGVDLEVVPFKGSAPAIMALLGGNVDLTTLDELTVLLHKEKVRILAIFSDKRSEKCPDVRTFKELGYDVPAPNPATGICGPPGLPGEISKILSDGLVKAIKNPEFIAKSEKTGNTPIYLSGPEFRIAAETSYKLMEEYKDILVEKK